MTTPAPLGFRVVGGPENERRLVNLAAAFTGYCQCDPVANIDTAAYLSAFAYPDDLRRHISATGSTKAYASAIAVPFVWFDIDRPNLDEALADARGLTAAILDRYRTLDDDGLLVFFSGAKGLHVGIATHNPPPTIGANAVAKRFASEWGDRANVRIDPAVYGPVQLFRAPNSRHPRSGCHKRRLLFAELMNVSAKGILSMAREPMPFDPPASLPVDPRFLDDWQEADKTTGGTNDSRAGALAATVQRGRLSKATLDFICNGADIGERHGRLFRAAGELGDFACPGALAHALLTEASLDAGLAPAEVHRQIECGLAHAARQRGGRS